MIGLYRLDVNTQLSLDALQTFDLQIRCCDDKDSYGLDAKGVQALRSDRGRSGGNVHSAVYGDFFVGVATQGIVSIKYDFDGEGQLDTVLSFQRVGG